MDKIGSCKFNASQDFCSYISPDVTLEAQVEDSNGDMMGSIRALSSVVFGSLRNLVAVIEDSDGGVTRTIRDFLVATNLTFVRLSFDYMILYMNINKYKYNKYKCVCVYSMPL